MFSQDRPFSVSIILALPPPTPPLARNYWALEHIIIIIIIVIIIISLSLSSFSLSLSLIGSPRRNIFVCFLTIKVFFSLSLLLFYYTVTPFVFFCSLVVFAVDIHASHKHTRFVTSLEKQTREKLARRKKKQNQKNTLFFVHRRTFHQLQLLFSHLCHTPIKLVRASLLSPPPPSPLPALFFYALMLLPAVTLRAKCRKCAP